MADISRPRPLERRRHTGLAARGQECERIARPALVVEVDGKEAAGVVVQQRIDAGDEIAATTIGSDAVLATQMRLDHLVGNGNERLARALAATDLWLAANAAHPFVGAGGRVAAATGFQVYPSRREHVGAARKQFSEESDLVGCRRAVGHGRCERRGRQRLWPGRLPLGLDLA